jgi:hypothetical protein
MGHWSCTAATVRWAVESVPRINRYREKRRERKKESETETKMKTHFPCSLVPVTGLHLTYGLRHIATGEADGKTAHSSLLTSILRPQQTGGRG